MNAREYLMIGRAFCLRKYMFSLEGFPEVSCTIFIHKFDFWLFSISCWKYSLRNKLISI